MWADLQVAESMPNKVAKKMLTRNDKKGYILHVTPKKKPEPLNMKNVRLVPTDEENAILAAAMKKHGLKKAVDVVRIALRRYAEAEGFELAS